MQSVVIVGGGQAGFQVAASLRENGHAGPVTIVADEASLPYGRPPLSKAYLVGKVDAVGLQLRPASFFREHDVEVRARERAVALDRPASRVRLGSGGAIAYDHLVLATGARNRTLPVPGAELAGVLQLRTVLDADAIRAELAEARRVVVVGAGFIGLEFAAVARARGLDVTVVEATGRPMARALSPAMSAFFRQAHEAAGITFLFDAAVRQVTGREGRATGVETADGRHVPADLVVVGIGVVPNTELAGEAGLPVANGIVVDAHLLTADPAISAIGDCAVHPSRYADGQAVRLESVQNAVDGARAVAARLRGRGSPYAAVPWFWSDQGPLKLQIAGLATSAHDRAVQRGRPEDGAFSVFCFRGERLAGVESVNRPADHMAARRLVAAGGIGVTPEQAVDLGFDLKAAAVRAG